MLVQQHVKPHVVAECLITMSIKDALSHNLPRQAFPAARSRAQARDQPLAEGRTRRPEHYSRAFVRCTQTSVNLQLFHLSESCVSLEAALLQRCHVCESQHHLGPQFLLEFAQVDHFVDTTAIALCVLTDCAGHEFES